MIYTNEYLFSAVLRSIAARRELLSGSWGLEFHPIGPIHPIGPLAHGYSLPTEAQPGRDPNPEPHTPASWLQKAAASVLRSNTATEESCRAVQGGCVASIPSTPSLPRYARPVRAFAVFGSNHTGTL